MSFGLGTRVVEHSAAPVAPATYKTEAKTVLVPEASVGAMSSPWWANVVVQRVGSEGTPMLPSFVNAYSLMFTKLGAILDVEDEFCPDALEAAQNLLKRAMFACSVPPSGMTWHGNDAVVFFWTVRGRTSLFTISADEVSYLQEEDGAIVDRRDSVPVDELDAIFPLSHGSH